MLSRDTVLLAANERLHSPRAGGYFVARGWSRINKTLGKSYLFQLRYCAVQRFQYTLVSFKKNEITLSFLC